MLDVLRFVRGAVATKDLVPVLSHFCIADGRIQGQNGRLTLDAPCPQLEGWDVVVPADKFLKAVDACDGEPKLKVDGDKLIISRGRFRATLSTLEPGDYPSVDAGGEWWSAHPNPTGFLACLETLLPFVATDASRPWACSILLTRARAFATNNVVLAAYEYDWGDEDLALPAYAVAEIVRIGIEPREICWNEHLFMAFYPDGSWLSSLLQGGQWPSVLPEIFAKADNEDQWLEVDDTLREAVERLKPFFPDAKVPIVMTGPTGVSTQDGVSSATVFAGELPKAAFRYESLSLVLEHATHWAAHRHPEAVPWKGAKLRGLLSGVRL